MARTKLCQKGKDSKTCTSEQRQKCHGSDKKHPCAKNK